MNVLILVPGVMCNCNLYYVKERSVGAGLVRAPLPSPSFSSRLRFLATLHPRSPTSCSVGGPVPRPKAIQAVSGYLHRSWLARPRGGGRVWRSRALEAPPAVGLIGTLWFGPAGREDGLDRIRLVTRSRLPTREACVCCDLPSKVALESFSCWRTESGSRGWAR